MSDPEFVELERGFGGPAVPHSIQDALEREGISCLVKTNSGIALALLGMPTLNWSLQVKQEDLERARQILVKAEEEGFDDSEWDDLRPAIRRAPSPETAPARVIGAIAGVLLVSGVITLMSSPLGVLLIALGIFAGFVAHRNRR